jgi:hypothetical protein
MEQAGTRVVLARSCLFFIGLEVLLLLSFLAHDFNTTAHPQIDLWAFLVLNIAAGIGTWRLQAWGYISAAVLSVLLVLLSSVRIVQGLISNPQQAVFVATMIMVGSLVVYFGLITWAVQRATGPRR